jgi:Xaa-Pro aminopeptidase
MTDRSHRLALVREALASAGLDGALISYPANRFYLSGFEPTDFAPDASEGVLLVDQRSATLLTGATNLLWAADEAPGWEAMAWERPWETTAAERIRERGWNRVGFEEHGLTVAGHRRLAEALGPGVALVPLNGEIERLRATKDAAELAGLTAVLKLTDDAFVAATVDLRPGITERELAWRIEREVRERGADGLAFPTIVAAGPHAARPHHGVSDRPLGEGEPIIIDMGANLGGYNGDLTRTIWLGEPSPRLRAVYNTVDRAQRAALAAIRPGAHGKDVDAVARGVIEEAGFGEHFVHGLGHGLGIRVHEAPSLAKTSEDVLQPGNVTTVEPGVYLPDWGGVRIEDVGVVEDGGFRVLTTAPKHPPFA